MPELLDSAALVPALSEAGGFAPTSVSDRLIRGTFDDTKLDIAAHPGEFTLGPPRDVEGLHVGSLQDVAASFSPLFVEEAQPPAAGVDV